MRNHGTAKTVSNGVQGVSKLEVKLRVAGRATVRVAAARWLSTGPQAQVECELEWGRGLRGVFVDSGCV